MTKPGDFSPGFFVWDVLNRSRDPRLAQKKVSANVLTELKRPWDWAYKVIHRLVHKPSFFTPFKTKNLNDRVKEM
jgi:hypothetical protein